MEAFFHTTLKVFQFSLTKMDHCALAASSAGSQCQNLTGENSSGGGWVGTIQLLDDQRAASCLLFKWAIHQKLLTKPYKGHDEDGVDHRAQCSIITIFALICKNQILGDLSIGKCEWLKI